MEQFKSAEQLLSEFMEERHSLGYSYKTEEGVLRRFLRDFSMPSDGKLEFTKEYVLKHTKPKPNQCVNSRLRDICAVNCFLDFVIRKGFKAYKIPHKSLPKEQRNFRAYIFNDEEISHILDAADSIPYMKQCPDRHYQLPVMFRILFNCGLRISELLNLRVCDVDMEQHIFTILDTKFHKNRLVPFSEVVADSLKEYYENVKPASEESWLFCRSNSTEKYSMSGFHFHFQMLLRLAGIPYGGRGKGPRPHDIRHTFAVHCLNNWVLSDVDVMTILPVLSRYMGHAGIKGTQKYLQLTAQMYPNVIDSLEHEFGCLIPDMEVNHEEL